MSNKETPTSENPRIQFSQNIVDMKGDNSKQFELCVSASNEDKCVKLFKTIKKEMDL